ncbi:hypothetical protein C8J57DRAFT_1732406 [Mycena rebaudengoi]|nr:hypothetical protein C8J57DRAFT_1732406 [Mycena rebaudengoi]
MSFLSNAKNFSLGEGVYNNVHGTCIVHNHLYSGKRRREDIEDGHNSLPLDDTRRKRRRRESEADDPIEIIPTKHLKLTHEIGSGPGYFIHAGENKGRAVIVKVFNAGPNVRQKLDSTVALSKGLMHPNVLRIEGISSRASLTQFISYESVHSKNAEGPLATALRDNLDRSITLGFKLVGGLSAGMNHIRVQGISLASLGEQNFDVFLDINDRFLISINSNSRPSENDDNTVSREPEEAKSWNIFNDLCRRVLKSANRVLHNSVIDRNPRILDHFRQPSIVQGSPTPASATCRPDPPEESSSSLNGMTTPSPSTPRREYVWRIMHRGQQRSLGTIAAQIAMDLELKSSTLNKLVWLDTRNAHRCVGYAREEITLATTTVDSAIIAHNTPSPTEICPICHEVVGFHEALRCICGDRNPGLGRTIRCRTCKLWSHVDCVGSPAVFICQICVCIPFYSPPDQSGQGLVLPIFASIQTGRPHEPLPFSPWQHQSDHNPVLSLFSSIQTMTGQPQGPFPYPSIPSQASQGAVFPPSGAPLPRRPADGRSALLDSDLVAPSSPPRDSPPPTQSPSAMAMFESLRANYLAMRAQEASYYSTMNPNSPPASAEDGARAKRKINELIASPEFLGLGNDFDSPAVEPKFPFFDSDTSALLNMDDRYLASPMEPLYDAFDTSPLGDTPYTDFLLTPRLESTDEPAGRTYDNMALFSGVNSDA